VRRSALPSTQPARAVPDAALLLVVPVSSVPVSSVSVSLVPGAHALGPHVSGPMVLPEAVLDLMAPAALPLVGR